MTRRELLLAAMAARVDYRDYARVLPDYLRRLAADAFQRRNTALAAIRDTAGARRRQQWVRETFWRLIGGQPQRTPLKSRVTGGFERERYRVEKVVYESRPGLHIPANLYLPKTGRGPYPGVLFQMGHSLNGKAAALYQYCCQGLVQLGFVVLAFDPMGQGERTYYPKPAGVVTRLGSADDEHSLPGKQLLLCGDTSTRLQVWDAVRSLDYLASHPMVDPKRLASTGNSGGGTLTMLLAAVDDRLACAAVACGNTENLACENFNPPGSTDDAEQNFVGSGPEGFDRWDTLYPMAPRPLLILASSKDFFGTYSPRYVENGRAEFARLKGFYELLGRADNVAWRETALPHGLSYELRMEIYRWFRRHLQGAGDPLDEEPPVKAESDETLWTTTRGNVVREYGGLTPLGLAQRQARGIQTPERPDDLRRLLKLPATPHAASARLLGTAKSRSARVEAVEVESEPGVFVPVWVFRPEQPRADAPTLLVVEPGGRNARWNEDGECQQLAARGITVIAPDVRGLGDLRPEYPRHSPGHARWHQDEEAYAWASLMLGRPLLGQRVTDLLAVRATLAPLGRVVVAALGAMTVPALFAAALDPAVRSLYLARGLESYRSLLEEEEYREPLSNFLFDVLRHADLPQIAQSMGPRLVARGSTWDLDTLLRLC